MTTLPLSRRRLILTVVAVLAAAAALSGTVDSTGKRYADGAFTQALVTFAMVRTLNGVISVAQGTEIAVEPAGVGVNFTVGQMLDPINDLIERFSAVMLVATSSLGLQNILLRITAWWGTSLVLGVAAAFALAAMWFTSLRASFEGLATRLLLLAVFVRFAVPVFVICTNLVSDAFLSAEQLAAAEALDATRVEIEELNSEVVPAATEDQSLLEQLGSVVSSSMESLNVTSRMAELRDRVSNASEHIINLIVIFVLQTIILPVVFLWAFVGLLKALAARTVQL